MCINDETASLSSMASFKYSNFNYSSGNESDDCELISPRRRDSHARCNPKSHQTSAAAAAASTRFCPKENRQKMYSHRHHGPSSGHSGTRYSSSNNGLREMSQIRAMLDIRSQLLHRSLVEEINRRRMFQTVGAVENIGFQEPCESPSKSLEKERQQFQR